MKPAFSVIFLTTLIGVGQGLFLMQFLAQKLSLFGLLDAWMSPREFLVGGVLSFLLLVAGLAASFFHLGHPERAWRAAAMWRTSWLSREVIALPLTMATIFAYVVTLYSTPDSIFTTLASGTVVPAHFLIASMASLTILVLFVCTSMIYACLKFLRQWHSPLTVCNFFLMGCASGATLAAALGVYYTSPYVNFYTNSAIIFTMLAGVSRIASLLRNQSLRKSSTTLQSATGIHHPTIRQMAQGAMGGSFNTRAFIHTYAASIVVLARRYFLFTVFVLPVLALFAVSAESALWFPIAIFALQYTGLLVERWYFFIEADHPQNAYYQMIS